jgi:translocator protein
MGFASWRVWKYGADRSKIPLLVYIIKLLLNWLWPLIAFGLGSMVGTLIDTLVLQVFVVLTGVLFFRIDKIAGILFVLYFLYLCYVLVLCGDIYILNS